MASDRVAGSKLALHADRLIDGTGRDPEDGRTVIVSGETIAAIGGDSHDLQHIDLEGCTLLPGLIDAHTHLAAVTHLEGDRIPLAVSAARIFRHCERVLDAGFTTVRETGGIDGGVVEAISKNLIRGPRIIPAGPILTQTGGHGDVRPTFQPVACCSQMRGVPGLFEIAVPCDGVVEVTKAARIAFMRGARFLKMAVTGGITSLTDDISDVQFTVDELRAAVLEAENRHTYVTVHTHTNEGIRRALDAGVACFEHCTELDEDTAERIAAQGAVIVPTLTIMHTYHENATFLPAEIIERSRGMAEKADAAVRVARKVGLTIGSGADLIGPDQHKYGLELVLKSRVLSPMEAIVSATSVNAKVVRDESIGSVAVGKSADLIAVRGDPLVEPELFSDPNRVVFVMKEGEVVKDITRD